MLNRYLVEITMIGQMNDCKYYRTIIPLHYVLLFKFKLA